MEKISHDLHMAVLDLDPLFLSLDLSNLHITDSFSQDQVRYITSLIFNNMLQGVQWLSGRVLNSRPRGRRLEPHLRHCFVSLSKNINPSLVLVQPRNTSPFITERLLIGRKESNQTNKANKMLDKQRAGKNGVLNY